MFRFLRITEGRFPIRIPGCGSTKLVRHSSQLYPSTGRKLDDAMVNAESIVGDSSNFSNLQKWVSGEFNNITKYLQKLIGTNHPMLETAKRCTYISEGKMGSAQARGLTVMLTARAAESLAKHSGIKDELNLIKEQTSLAEMTEMTYSAYIIHRGVMDLHVHDNLRYGTSQEVVDETKKGLHYGNKVSILCGDFLLAYVMRGLGDLFNSKVVDLVASAITDFMEGEFLLLDDWRSNNYLMSREATDIGRWQRRSYATIGSLQEKTCEAALVLAGIKGKPRRDAAEFGRNLGLAWQAHTELQPFLKEDYEPIELPEMPLYPSYDLNCLPVLLFVRNACKTKNYRLMLNEIKGRQLDSFRVAEQGACLMNQHRHQEVVDYSKLHSLILTQGRAVDETYDIIREYSQTAIRHLESFPPSVAKDALGNICESLYKK